MKDSTTHKMITSLLKSYYSVTKTNKPNSIDNDFDQLFISSDSFLKKIKTLDNILKNYNIPDDIGELAFDLLLFNFFSQDSERLSENYFESKEWHDIEEKILDRGTELMNILLYLQECKDSEIKVTLDDYLDEYLISDDDIDTEEHEIYEAIIKNRDEIITGNIETMVMINKFNSDSSLNEQLLPILLFFESKSSLDKKQEAIMMHGEHQAFQSAFLSILSSFN